MSNFDPSFFSASSTSAEAARFLTLWKSECNICDDFKRALLQSEIGSKKKIKLTGGGGEVAAFVVP